MLVAAVLIEIGNAYPEKEKENGNEQMENHTVSKAVKNRPGGFALTCSVSSACQFITDMDENSAPAR